jgi:glutamyl-tRNA reductase
MVFVACGLNHKTAPLALREKIALPSAEHDALLKNLIALSSVNEAAILSTCNRTEIYCETSDPLDIAPWLAKEHQVALETLIPHLYLYTENQAVRHTLRVASGLDSMMLGEPQILGQIKQAYQNAYTLGFAKSHLRCVFEYIFGAAKRIRHQSGIGKNPISVAYAAVQLIIKHYSDVKGLTVFLIGSGETATLVAKYLLKAGVTQFLVASRSPENAQQLAFAFNGQALTISDIPLYLSEADVVISATACPLPFINKKMVSQALEKRQFAEMLFLDLAVPRDIEAEVAELEHVHLYNVDDLQTLTEKGMDERRQAALEAESLVNYEVDNYIRWHRSYKARDLICDYREFMQQLANQELEKALQRLSLGQCQQTVLTEFSQRLVNKLTHLPSVGLKQVAWEGDEAMLQLAQYLFNTSKSRHIHEEIA